MRCYPDYFSDGLKHLGAQGMTSDERKNYEQSYAFHIADTKELYGHLNKNNKLYKNMRDVLDRLLIASKIDPHTVKFDLVLDQNMGINVYAEKNHIFFNIGTLFFLTWSESLSKDIIAAAFAHELVHIKYANKPEVQGESSFDRKVKKYVLRREEERVADHEALCILNDAGFNPNALIILFRQLGKIDDNDDNEIDNMIRNMRTTVHDEHESTERRIEYLQYAMDNSLLKNRDKPMEPFGTLLKVPQKDWGFFNHARKGQSNVEIFEKINEPWQLISLIKSLGKPSDPQIIKTAKERIFTAARLNLSEIETDLFWEILISNTPMELSLYLDANEDNLTDVDFPKLVAKLPDFFSQLERAGVDMDALGLLAPLENAIISLGDVHKIAKQCIEDWHQKYPKWITALMQASYQAICVNKNVGVPLDIDEYLKITLDLLKKEAHEFTPKQAETIFSQLADLAENNKLSDLILFETSIREFSKSKKINAIKPTESILKNKFRLLKIIRNIDGIDLSITSDLDVFLIASQGLSPQERAAIFNFKWTDIENTRSNSKHLPWNLKSEDEQSKEKDKLLEICDWEISSYNLWVLVIIKLILNFDKDDSPKNVSRIK